MYSVGGKIVSVGNKFPENRINTLTFEVRGANFPNFDTQSNSSAFYFSSTIQQSVQVNWGDGTTSNHSFAPDTRSGFRVGWTQDGEYNFRLQAGALAANHSYIDGSTEKRTITFLFDDLSKINEFASFSILIEGAFPSSILSAESLTSIILSGTKGITSFPLDLSKNKLIEEIVLSRCFPSKLSKIPDSFFDLDLKVFEGSASFNLSDNISSNLFKINQWENLERLYLDSCDIIQFDQSFFNLTKLSDLRIRSNNFTNFNINFSKLENLIILYYGVSQNQNTSFPNFDLLNVLSALVLQGNYNLGEIPTKWVGLKSLKTIDTNNLILTNDRFDLFIDQIYLLVTQNAYLNPSSVGAGETYPDQFRDMSYGESDLTASGAIQEPVDFVQGSNNGNPINQGQKIYVLVNNYGHTITTS
jgi:hypothetical protein